ncbi:MAG: DUF4328 domain-containing protein [Chloroflexi bacterium]|nr:DUF4328 domain-containing protein [Chloroflexota bacterium]
MANESPLVNAALRHYRAPRNLAIIVIVGFVLLGIVTVASIVSSYMELSLITQVQAGEPITTEEAESNDLRQAVVGYIFVGVTILAIVAFLFWIYRISDNADILKFPGEQAKRFSPWGAVGWWFCPFLNLWRPYQVVKELWLRSEARGPRSLLMPIWWFLWIVNGLIGQIFLRNLLTGNQPETIDDLAGQNQLGIFSDGLSLLALALVVILVWLITNGQEGKWQRLAEATSAP